MEFKSALLKIDRAGRQADDLYNESVALFHPTESDEPAYRIVVERDSDPRKWRAIFRQVKQPPEDWNLLLGEIIHNLRSALDHLVYEASSLDENGQRLIGTEYPIFIDEGLYRERGVWRIRGLNAGTRALVEELQPFANSDPEIVHGLWMLHELSNTDKHRLLNVVTVAHILGNFNAIISFGGTTVTQGHLQQLISVTKNARLQDGAEFYSFMTREPLADDAQVSVNPQIAVQVRLGDAWPRAEGMDVFEALRVMGRFVGTIRNEFIKRNP